MYQKESFYWWSQRIFSVALIPLFIWVIFLVFSIIAESKSSTISIISTIFASHHLYGLLLIGVLISLHIRLGLEEVVEDYIHDEKVKLICSLCLRLLAIKMIHDLYLWSVHFYIA